jgi:hypothetical protein
LPGFSRGRNVSFGQQKPNLQTGTPSQALGHGRKCSFAHCFVCDCELREISSSARKKKNNQRPSKTGNARRMSRRSNSFSPTRSHFFSVVLNSSVIVLFQAKEIFGDSRLPSVKSSIATALEKTENEVGVSVWLVLNVLDQTRITVVR